MPAMSQKLNPDRFALGFGRVFLPHKTDGGAILLRSGRRDFNAAAFRAKRQNYVSRGICWLGVDQRGDKACTKTAPLS